MNHSRETVSVFSKVNIQGKKLLEEQIVENPLCSINEKTSFVPLSRMFKRLVLYLDAIMPEIDNFLNYFGIEGFSKLVEKNHKK